MKLFLQSCTIGEWFFLYQIGKNVDRRFFYDFVQNLTAKKMGDIEVARANLYVPLVDIDNEKFTKVTVL